MEKYEYENKEKFYISEFSSGTELCSAKETLSNCHIVFLDINMEEQDGLKIAIRLKELYPDIMIVLVTAYMGYALEELHRKNCYVEISFVEGEIRLLADDIIYIETSRHKNIFYTKKKTYTIYKKLDELERELTGYGFVRVHQSFLVNMRYIEKISSYVLRLITGKEISVPKARYQEVKRSFALYKGAV